MAASDILVGRAGATFIAEASVLSSTCVIIPAAHLSGGHQVENAKILEKNKAVMLIEEKDLTEENLFSSIDNLLSSKEKRQELGRSLRNLERTDAAEAISNLILGD
jgi:UDP-N-acetylglucosamine--N-acetylmuramyl-(pentapeptide) pyrophosphoryl-undecaprenol N-acetylglucosamine transferase